MSHRSGDWPDSIANTYPSGQQREALALVYVNGEIPAIVTGNQGHNGAGCVHLETGLTEYAEWDRMWDSRVETLRFGIAREWPNDRRSAQWRVFGTLPDESGDACWGQFDTWREAYDFTIEVLKERAS